MFLDAKKLKAAREAAALTQPELAKKGGLAFSTQVSRYEITRKGRTKVNPGTMKRLARALGVPVAALEPDAAEVAQP